MNAIKSTLGYAVTGDEHILNAYNIELNIKQYQEDATELMKLLGKTEGDTERYENEIKKIYEKIKILREQLAIAKAQSERSSNANNEIIRLTDALKKDSLSFEEFDDSIVRRVVECMRVMGDKSIIITLKGGIELYGKIK